MRSEQRQVAISVVILIKGFLKHAILFFIVENGKCANACSGFKVSAAITADPTNAFLNAAHHVTFWVSNIFILVAILFQ